MGLKLFDAVGESGLAAWLKPYAMVWARKANDDGTKCNAGVTFVADYLGKQPEITRRARNALIAMGVLETETIIRYGRRWVKVVGFDRECLPPRMPTAVGVEPTAIGDMPTTVGVEPTTVGVKPTAVGRTSKELAAATSPTTSSLPTIRERIAARVVSPPDEDVVLTAPLQDFDDYDDDDGGSR